MSLKKQNADMNAKNAVIFPSRLSPVDFQGLSLSCDPNVTLLDGAADQAVSYSVGNRLNEKGNPAYKLLFPYRTDGFSTYIILIKR